MSTRPRTEISPDHPPSEHRQWAGWKAELALGAGVLAFAAGGAYLGRQPAPTPKPAHPAVTDSVKPPQADYTRAPKAASTPANAKTATVPKAQEHPPVHHK